MWMKTLGMSVALATAAGVGAQVWVHEPARTDAVVRDTRLLREVMLAGHNETRATVGAVPLTWDERLALDAAAYADELTHTGRYQHSTGRRGAEPEGENLWAGSKGDYSYAEMFGHWRAEQRDFKPGVVPNISRTGNFADVAHYANIIWPTTRRLGCAMAANQRTEYLVCRYAPPGNIVGRQLG